MVLHEASFPRGLGSRSGSRRVLSMACPLAALVGAPGVVPARIAGERVPPLSFPTRSPHPLLILSVAFCCQLFWLRHRTNSTIQEQGHPPHAPSPRCCPHVSRHPTRPVPRSPPFDASRYRQLANTMDERFPDATEEELESCEHTCIICRDAMDAGKKLPCGHIFHFQ